MTLQGHTYTGDKDGITLKLSGGETVFFPLISKLYRQYEYRRKAAGSMVDTACATIAPGKAKAPTTSTDINILHCTFGHIHGVLLKKTATQQGIAYNGDLHVCRRCSMAKGLRKPIARSTHKKLQRVFVDLSVPMTVQSIGGKLYELIVRDDYTWFTRVHFLRRKSDVASAFKSFLVEMRAEQMTHLPPSWLFDRTTGESFSEELSGNWYQTRVHTSRQPQVQRCSRTDVRTDQRCRRCRSHPSS